MPAPESAPTVFDTEREPVEDSASTCGVALEPALVDTDREPVELARTVSPEPGETA